MPPARPWPVTAIAWLLLLQTGGLILLALSALDQYWPAALDPWATLRLPPLNGLLLAFIALLAVSAAFGFFRQARGAWVSAVMAQGFTLGLALLLYFRDRPPYVYLLMVYAIFMVLYLHQADVQAAFQRDIHPRSAPQTKLEP